MGIEFTLLLIIFVLAGVAFFFFSGAYGAARTERDPSGARKESDDDRPQHVYVENEIAARSPGDDETEHTRQVAESDPSTEVR